jgi:hypothetical protein
MPDSVGQRSPTLPVATHTYSIERLDHKNVRQTTGTRYRVLLLATGSSISTCIFKVDMLVASFFQTYTTIKTLVLHSRVALNQTLSQFLVSNHIENQPRFGGCLGGLTEGETSRYFFSSGPNSGISSWRIKYDAPDGGSSQTTTPVVTD